MTTSDDTVLGTAVICTALDVEYRAVREHLDGPFDEREKNGTLYQVGTFRTDHGRWVVALAQTGAGNTRAGIELERAISVFHPQIVLFVGVAGGRKDVETGDVVVADEIYDYESGKDTASEFLPRLKTKAPAHRLIERAKALARDDAWQHRILPAAPKPAPKAVIKPIAAGSAVIADQNAATARYLATYCGDAAAVEMEGYGFLHGAYVNDTVQALVVRGISDLLSGKTETADAHWQPTASSHAAAFAFELLARHTPPPNPAAGAIPQQLLAPPARFVGRADQLAELDRALTTPEGSSPGAGPGGGPTAVISAIGGTGGIGKTWLALTWAHRHLERFPDGQLFVDLHGFSPTSEPVQPATVVRGFLDALGVEANRIPTDLDAQAALYRSLVAGRRMLIVLDNAATSDQVAPLLPGSPSCTVLVTGRHRLASLIDRYGARHLPLDVLSPEEARRLLAARLGADRVTAEPEAVDELIGLCGGHPLALSITARTAGTRPGVALAEVATELRDLGLEALDHDTDPAASLPTVLSWSLRYLTDTQRTVFALLGIAPGPDTTPPATAALTGLPGRLARRTLSGLENASLLERRAGSRYTMHDLIRRYATDTAHTTLPEEVREAALTRVGDFHLHTAHAADRLLDPHRALVRPEPPAPGVHPHPLPNTAAALAWLDAEHATLLATQRTAAALGHHHTVWHLAWNLTVFHRRRGHRHDEVTTWQAALEAADHLPDPATRSRTHRLLGRACSRLGLHEQATTHLERALDLAVRHHDPTDQAHTHRVLAFAWERRGDDRQALEHAQRAVDLYRAVDQPVWGADALNAVGWHAARLGWFDTAREHCQAALTLHRHHHNPNGEATTLDSLGYIAHHTGDHHQALDHYHHALTLNRGRGHAYEVTGTLDRMGHPYVALGQHEQARTVWREALQLYREQGRDADAERVQRQLDDLGYPGQNVP
ncbi:phosphorylase family protein [Amycolatopsis sp. CA-230715]|uniref:phosphorylase family protein n=1 Tax=Amycolatopsis sp. CA-230715 TaxID=2745196 RepID=UPI001C034784|nr:tetratricopeptide repeat protein [Amycolatopsis sp. CA-230715]QWF85648.1 5'-methylthioadenosine/S-adenosylhomocysteine nucleosidase [Amycolatopsis sp. CA-230715]